MPRKAHLRIQKFAKPGELWLPVLNTPVGARSEDEEFIYHHFNDREPAYWYQIEQGRLESGLFPVGRKSSISMPSSKRASKKANRRVRRVRFEFNQPKVVDFVGIPKLGGAFKVVAEGVEVIPDRSIYENVMIRDVQRKKEKVLNRIYASSRRLQGEIAHELERFDEFFCVDSNTCTHSSGRVLITTILEGNSSARTAGGSLLSWRYVATLFSKAPANCAERKGWLLAIQWLEAESRIGLGLRLGLIVDSELGLLPAIQSGETPLVEGAYLPTRWELLYATSDRGAEEYFPNRMISEADRFCRAAAKRIERKDLSNLFAEGALVQFVQGFLVPPSGDWNFPKEKG